MRIRELHNSIVARLLGVSAITLYPFIFYAGVPGETLRRHEWEHVLQVRRLGWFKFYWLYLKEYLSLRLKGLSHSTAYINISFEEEAFYRQNDGDKPWELEA